ncbi:MAG: histidine kinase [Gaiellaceae bacterium]
MAGQEQERRRLARELHDETAQALTSILLGLRALEGAADAGAMRLAAASLRELVVETLQDVRRLAVQLRPKVLDDFGLVPALEHLAESVSEQTGVRVEVASQLDSERLQDEMQTTCTGSARRDSRTSSSTRPRAGSASCSSAAAGWRRR